VGDQELSGDAARETAVSTVSRRVALAALAAIGSVAQAQQDAPPALERIRKRGSLIVGVYQDLPPFSVAGEGVDVDLARALSKALGLELSLLPFTAGENMDDDLRNMVWRGHYLGFGPADVLLHVPVDAPLMRNNPRVNIFAPYYRERLVMARDIKRVPKGEVLADFAGQKVAVAGQSLAGWLMIGADGGGWREQLITTWKDGAAAARALQGGEVAAAAGQLSEIEAALDGDARFVIEPLPVPRMRDGWVIGCAVKREATDLAQAVQVAINTLATSGELGRLFAKAKLSWRAP
jgi:ABC-type amino acid transport substrate-binding protein